MSLKYEPASEPLHSSVKLPLWAAYGPMQDTTPAQWDRIMDTNVNPL